MYVRDFKPLIYLIRPSSFGCSVFCFAQKDLFGSFEFLLEIGLDLVAFFLYVCSNILIGYRSCWLNTLVLVQYIYCTCIQSCSPHLSQPMYLYSSRVLAQYLMYIYSFLYTRGAQKSVLNRSWIGPKSVLFLLDRSFFGPVLIDYWLVLFWSHHFLDPSLFRISLFSDRFRSNLVRSFSVRIRILFGFSFGFSNFFCSDCLIIKYIYNNFNIL